MQTNKKNRSSLVQCLHCKKICANNQWYNHVKCKHPDIFKKLLVNGKLMTTPGVDKEWVEGMISYNKKDPQEMMICLHCKKEKDKTKRFKQSFFKKHMRFHHKEKL